MMNFCKKVLRYYKTVGIIALAKYFLIFTFICGFLIYSNEINNRNRVYENLRNIMIGEDVDVSIKKMKRLTIFLEHQTEPCNDCFDDNQHIYQIVFKHKNPNDYPNDYPRLYYDERTNKVTGTWNGSIGN